MLRVAPPRSTARMAAAGPYVLLVDDHEPSLRKLHQVVQVAGHRCVMALSASEALRHCDAQRPRLVVTDLSMPNLDGLGLADWMHLRFPSVPLILMTGQFLDPALLATLGRRFTAVMTKPIDVERLLGRVERLMPPRLIAESTLTARIRSPYHAMV